MMSIQLESVVFLVWIHFVADFILQSDAMAKNKSTDSRWLLLHVCVYSLPFLYFGIVFAVVNGILHFATDYVSSRAASHMWAKDERHWFFVVIGADQALHLTALVGTYVYFGVG